MKKIYVAVLGVGTVGESVIKALQDNKDIITARTGFQIIPKIGIARDIKNKNVDIPLSTNIDDALNDEEIDIIVELIGGIELPYKIALKALENKKSFVTANKAMLAYHRHELESKSNNIPIAFEASVCGGIPIIKILRDGLCANHILNIRGIMNGTSNYILTQMSKNKKDFDSALEEAQSLGYAEANPTLDINGADSAHKLLILASIAYGINARLEDIIVEGISGITLEDIRFAKEFGYEIKLLGIARKVEKEVELRVHLCMIPKDSMLSKVDGAMNAISLIGDKVGETLYYGAGAGGDATASSVISDIMEIARSKTSPMLGYVGLKLDNDVIVMPKDNIKCSYYIRLEVSDKPGVLSNIANILAQNEISIRTLIQKKPKKLDFNRALLLLSTHTCSESQIQKALCDLNLLQELTAKPFMIRIEDC